MASESDHSASEGVDSSATIVGVGVPPASPAGSAQGSSASDPAPHPVFEILQRLEDLLRRTAVIVSEGAREFHDVLPLMEEGLEVVCRVGGPQLAWRCERELDRLEGWMYRLEGLVQANASDVPPPLTMRFMSEREDLAKCIQAREAELKCLRKQHRAVLAEMDAYTDAAFFEDVGSLKGEARLWELECEKMRLSHVTEAVAGALQLLRQ